jgi:phosphatidylinositol alpha-1,6-mannosyltransferase
MVTCEQRLAHPAPNEAAGTGIGRSKVMLISAVFPPIIGGSGHWFWEIYRRLPRRDVVVAAGIDPRQAEFDRTHDLNLTRVSLRVRPPGLIRPPSLLGYAKAVARLRRLARAERVGLLHAGCVLPEGLMALALKGLLGLPYACYAHGEEFEVARSSRELAGLARLVLKGAASVIANSRNTARILTDGWGVPAGKVRVMHPGVDTTRFIPSAPDPAFRERLGWSGRTVLLTVARLQEGKGHDRMIPAVGRLREAYPRVLYAVVGDGPERPKLERLTARLGLGEHVQFLGAIGEDDLIRCYQQCDLFVLPNRRVGQNLEGFGMVLLEAQACGKPVVAGNSGGTAEAMEVPATGLLADCESPEALAGTLADLLAEPGRLAAMGTAGRRLVVDRFDWSALSRRAEASFWPGSASEAS